MNTAKRYVGIRQSKNDAERKQFGAERRLYFYGRTMDDVVRRLELLSWELQPDVIQLDTGEWKSVLEDRRKSGIGT